MANFLSSVFGVAKSLGSVVDKAVPVGVGDRTKTSAVLAVALPLVSKIVCTVYPKACPLVDSLGQVAALLTPVFAGAGLVRDK